MNQLMAISSCMCGTGRLAGSIATVMRGVFAYKAQKNVRKKGGGCIGSNSHDNAAS